jgi:hypothetical protein
MKLWIDYGLSNLGNGSLTTARTRTKILLGFSLSLAALFFSGCTGGSSSSETLKSGGLGVTLELVSGDQQITTPSATWSSPLVVRVVNSGAGAASIPITFTNASANSASIVNPVLVTDSQGYAQTSVVAPNVSNIITKISAATPDGTSVTFSLQTRSFPDTPTLNLQDPVTLSVTYTKQALVNVTIAQIPSVNKWCLSETQSTRPPDGTVPCLGGAGPDNGWYDSIPTSFLLSSLNGVKTVYVWVADQFQQTNLNTSVGNIYLDTIPPGTPTVTLSDVLTGSITDTGSSIANFSVTNDGDASYWCIFPQLSTNPAPAAPVWNSPCWVPSKPTTVTLPNFGINEVYVWTKDLAGNVSAAPGTQFINYTTANIGDPVVVMTDPVTLSQTYARQPTINLSITGEATASKWCVSETQSTRPANSLAACAGGSGPYNGWLGARPTSYILSGGDGLKTVYFWVANPLLNVNPDPVSKTITVITTPPSIPLVTLTDPNTNLQNFTNQSTVNLSITLDTNAVRWCIYERSSLAAPPGQPAWNDACWHTTRPTQVALGATGSRRVYVYTQDIAYNISPGSGVALITYTTTPPSNPIGVLQDPVTYSTTLSKNQTVNLSINSPTGTVGWCASETQTTQPATGTSPCVGGTGPNNGWYANSPTSFTLSPADGLKTVYLWVADNANNVNTTTSTATITLDRTAPGTPVVVMSDPNTGSTTDTNQIIPNLSVTNDAGATAWCRLIQDPAAAAPGTPGLNDICWTLSRPTNVVLDQAGTRELYLFIRDAAGNVGVPATATITYSLGVPGDPTVILADAVTSLTTYAKQTSVNLTIANDTNANSWCVSETQTTRPNLGTVTCMGGLGTANGWSTAKPTTWTLSSGDGIKHVYVWTANTSNSVNNNPSFGNITLLTATPPTATVALSDPNTNSPTNTNQSLVTLAISGENAQVSAWCVLEQAAATAAPSTPLFSNACWTTSKPNQVTLGGLGNRKVYVYFRDVADNVSPVAGMATIVYSTSAPAVPTLTFSDPTTSSTTYARQVAVSAAVTGDTGAVKWCVSETQTLRPSLGTSNCLGGGGSANGWFTTRPATYTLSTGDGAKTVYIWTADVDNNTSLTAGTGTITLDSVPPSVPFVAVSDSTTGSTSVTNQTPASLSITLDTNAVQWCVIEQSFAASVPSQPAWNAGCWVSTRPTSVGLGATGVRRVFVFTEDIAYNISPAAGVGQINYSTSPPSNPVLVLSNPSTGSVTITKDRPITPSITSPSGTVEWCLSETQTTKPASGSAVCNGGQGPSNGWFTSLPTSFTISAGDGLKTVYLWVSDTTNNVSSGTVTATITLDTTPPATPTVSMSDPNTGSTTSTNQFNVNLSITADTNAFEWCTIVQLSATTAPSTPLLTDSCWRTSRPSTAFISSTGPNTAYVFTRDVAGNIGTAGTSSINYQVLAPADPTLVVADSVTGLTTFAKGVALTATIGNDATATLWCLSESQNTRPALGSSACNGGAGPNGGWYTSRPTSINLSATQTMHTVYLWTSDNYNNVNSDPVTAQITLDTTPPLVPSVSIQDPNTGSSTNTNKSSVTLNIGTTIDALAWCVYEQATATAAPATPVWNNACWVTTVPTTLTLGATGSRSVYVFTRDHADNVSTSAGTASITYSTTAPVTAALALSDATTSSASYLRQVAAQVAITGDTGAVKWCLSQTQTAAPALGTAACTGGVGSSNGWSTSRPPSFSVSTGDGAKTVYLWTADLNNNVSVTAATATITLDTTPPAIPSVALSDPNTSSTAFTNQSTVNTSITGDTDAMEWCVIEQSAATSAPTAPLYNNACFAVIRPTTTALGAQGNRRVYVYTEDAAGNVSVAPSVASISYSTTAPTDPVLVLSDSVTGSRTYTNNRTVSVSINSPASTVQWCLSETQTARPANGTAICNGGQGPSNGWFTSLPSTFQLSNSTGLKTVYVWVADNSNNTNTNQSSANISLLLTAPAAPTVALADPNTLSSGSTNQNTVNLTITNDTGATAWCAMAQDAAAAAPSTPSTSSTCWQLTRPTTVPLGAVGTRTAYVFLRDAAQNISAAGSASITLSVTPPGDPTFTIADATTGQTNFAQGTATTVTITNDATAVRWCLSETQTVQPNLGTSTCTGGGGTSSGWYTTRPTTYTLSNGDGTKRVYVWVANAYNNVNIDSTTQQIVLNTQLPGTFNITGLTGGTDTTADAYLGTTTTPTVNWAASSTATLYSVQIKNSAGTTVVCAPQTTSATSYTFTGCTLTAATSYKAYVTAQNNAQGASNASNNGFSFTVTLTPPGVFNIAGVTGGPDTTADAYSGSSLPTISWSAASGAATYTVRVLAMDGTTVMCPLQTKAAGVLSHDYSTTGCSTLVNNTLYQAEVIAYDIASNPRTATNSLFVFRTDLTLPTVTITGNPASQAITALANFTFSSSDAISGIAGMLCQIDGGGFSACSTSTTQTYASLANGSHTFTVEAVDVAGNTATASYTWQIDSTLPTAFTISGATGPTDNVVDNQLRNDTEMIANWTSSSTATSYQVTILNSDNSVACPMVTVAAGTLSHDFAGCFIVNPGSYQIQVVAVRGYGTTYAPTPMVITAAKDTVTATITSSASTVNSGSNVTLTLVGYENGTQLSSNVLSPSFVINSGTSTGTFGTVNYIGSGTYQATFTGTSAGTAAVISASTSLLGGFSSVTSASVTVTAGGVSPAVTTVTASQSTVLANNIDFSTITIQARDAASNPVTGAFVSAIYTGGSSTGTFTTFTESPAGSGNYTAKFMGTIAGTATSIKATVNTVTITQQPTVTVLPGPPVKIAASGPTALTTHTCAGPYTVTLRDANNNLASATSNVQINFGGLTLGNFSLSADCSTNDTNYTIFLGGSTAAPVYIIPRAPNAAASFTFSDNAATLTQGTLAAVVTGNPAWIGISGQNAWLTKNGFPSRSSLDGLNQPRGLYLNMTSNKLYAVDTANSRVVRYDLTSHAMTGWVGRVDSADGINCAGYSAPSSGGATPGWCLGGSAQASAGTNFDGMLNNPSDISGDGTYLYVLDTSNNRVVRYLESTGVYSGWYGNISTIAGMTCNSGSPVASLATPDWCFGGTSKVSSGTSWDGMFNMTTLAAIRAFSDPASGTTVMLVLDAGNHRMMRFTVSSSHIVYNGWAGRTNSTAVLTNGINATTCGSVTNGNATTGWCMGGVSTSAPAPTTPTVSSYDNMFFNPRGLAVVPGTPSVAYFMDTNNGRIVQFNVTSGTTAAWTGRSTFEYPGAGGTNCATYNTDTGWCTSGVPIYSGYCYPNCTSNTAARSYYPTYGLALDTDGTYLYQSNNNRPGLYQIPLSTAVSGTVYWTGRISTQPTTGPGCSTTPQGFATPNWCAGGAAGTGYYDGQFITPIGVAADTNHGAVYVIDTTLHKIQVIDMASGTSDGWIGGSQNATPATWLTSYTPGLQGNFQFPNDDASFGGGIGYTGTSGVAIGTNSSGDTTPYMFVADTANNRVKRYIASSGTYKGWYGKSLVVPVPTSGSDPCGSITSGALTPTWCYQGSSQQLATTGTGELRTPMGLATDGTYLYIADQTWSRIVRVVMSSGSFAGWMGRTNAAASLTGFDTPGNAQCATVGATTFTGAWCANGSHVNSTVGDGSMTNPRGISVDATNGFIYVADTGGARINKYTSAGAFEGFLGNVSTAPTTSGPTTGAPNSTCTASTANKPTQVWCIGGVSATGNVTTQAFGGFSSPEGVSYDNGNIYVADTSNNKVHKFNAVTGAYLGWIGRTNTALPSGVGTGSGLTLAQCTTGLTLGNATPGWCTGGGSQASGGIVFDNAFSAPSAIWSDPNSSYLYVVDAGNHRITKHNKASGAYVGWQGVTLTTPTGGAMNCTTATVGTVTPGWCTGGSSQSSRQFGGFYNPIAITGDANFIYVTDTYNNRVMALPK